MLKQAFLRRLLLGVALGAAALSAPVVVGSLTPAYAQVSAEFQAALEPYGEWRRNARFGEVWVPDDRPAGWRPYTEGHWVYTDDWGWYWVADDEEADWGWVTYHYGRWVHDRGSWFWVPGDEWAPAWVDWRRGNDYVGWAPLPPELIIDEDEYTNDPGYWVFVQPRYMIAPRLRTYYLPQQRAVIVFRQTVVVNRTVRLEHNRNRFAVNPGIAPGIIGLAAHRSIPTFRVQPRVLAGTHGVIGAVQVRPQDFGRRGQPRAKGVNPLHATIEPTKTVVQPVKSVPKAQPLGKDEHGRLGSHPPRAAQGGTIAPPQAPAPKVAPATQTPPSPACGHAGANRPCAGDDATTPRTRRRCSGHDAANAAVRRAGCRTAAASGRINHGSAATRGRSAAGRACSGAAAASQACSATATSRACASAAGRACSAAAAAVRAPPPPAVHAPPPPAARAPPPPPPQARTAACAEAEAGREEARRAEITASDKEKRNGRPQGPPVACSGLARFKRRARARSVR